MEETLNNTPAEDTSTSAHETVTEPSSVTHQEPPATAEVVDAKDSAPVSSAEVDKDAKADLLSVVQNALDEADPEDSSTDGNQDGDAGENTKTEEAQKDGADEVAADAKQHDKVPFHNHPRWKEMIGERDSLKPRAEQYDKIMGFMRSNGLTPQEMAEGLRVMALMRNNPAEAYQSIQGYAQRLAEMTGDKLPDDVKERLESGLIDDDSAKELARLKAERRAAEEQAVRMQQEALVANQRAMHDAVATWEKRERAKDPDWDSKYEMVKDRVVSIMSQERPANPSDAIKVASRALAEVNDRLRPLAGRSGNVRTPISSVSSSSTRQAPRSLEEVVRMGLSK